MTLEAFTLEQLQAEIERRNAYRAGQIIPATTQDAPGWIVGNGDQTKWRTWCVLGPEWTDDRNKATRYARREDAELVHAEDEDAWSVVLLPTRQEPPVSEIDLKPCPFCGQKASVDVTRRGFAAPTVGHLKDDVLRSEARAMLSGTNGPTQASPDVTGLPGAR